MRSSRARSRLLQTAVLIAASIVVAVFIVRAGLVPQLLSSTGDSLLISSFIAGLFFTSLFTTAPAIAVLGELGLHGNVWVVSLIGALGAVLGDYLLYAFVRDRVSADAAFLLRGPRFKRMWHVIKHSHFRRVLPFLGGVIIASPLPDELGLAMLGVSSISTRAFFAISYCMNAFGILFIGFVARAMVG